jgi:cation transport ATPase
LRAIPGRGVQGWIDGPQYWLANHRLAKELERCSPALEARLAALERQGNQLPADKLTAIEALGAATRAVLAQNIMLALGVKVTFLAFTLAGMGTMWMAVFAGVGASLLVIGNGLRLLRK